MILQSLHALYDRLVEDEAYGIAPPGHSIQKITFRVVLYPDGQRPGIEPVFQMENGKERPRQIAVLGNGKPSGKGVNPCFLWDNTAYMLGYKPEDPKPERSEQCFEAFRQRHLDLEQDINCPAFSAVCRFLEWWSPDKAAEYPVLATTTTGFGVFQIAGQPRYVHQDATVRAWWLRQEDSDGEATQGKCLLTGDNAPIARLHPKVKGVVGGQAVKPLVSFDKHAYESYGKSQGDNAPVGEEAAIRYGAALNALLDGPMQRKHRLQLGDATVVFWTEQPTVLEDVLASFMQGNAEEEAQAAQDEDRLRRLAGFLRALREGGPAKVPAKPEEPMDEEEERVPFYILGLSSNAARISVRLFCESTVREMLGNLRRHFGDIGTKPQSAKGRQQADSRFPAARQLLAQTLRDPKDRGKSKQEVEKPQARMATALLHSIVSGTDYPRALYDAVLRRIRANCTINYPRICVLKGYLVRNLGKEIPMSLDPANPDPAYRLGRLFAALEKTQREAIKNINATIRDRFYSAASATPGVVFPRLLRTYQHHLGKLDKGLRINRERLVQEIVGPLSAFPARLGLPEQGVFAIGYYHQTQDFYTAKERISDATDSE